jgi:hypothetical protein
MNAEETKRAFNTDSTRSRAGTALIALRQAIGKTQQQFAVDVLGSAVTTVARYETSNPPSGEVLVRLADIAKENNLIPLRNEFTVLYLEEVLKNVTFNMFVQQPKADGTPASGYLVLKLEGTEEIKAAAKFVDSLKGTHDELLKAARASTKRTHAILETPLPSQYPWEPEGLIRSTLANARKRLTKKGRPKKSSAEGGKK